MRTRKKSAALVGVPGSDLPVEPAEQNVLSGTENARFGDRRRFLAAGRHTDRSSSGLRVEGQGLRRHAGASAVVVRWCQLVPGCWLLAEHSAEGTVGV